jgi:uncharacterized protein YjbI with pentapeptide repeats
MMTSAGRYCGGEHEIDTLLDEARRETLALAIASCAFDDDAAAIASARLRWAIDAVRPLIMAAEHQHQPDCAPRAELLDRIANRAQHWLVDPPRPLRDIRGLIDRTSLRRRRAALGAHAANAANAANAAPAIAADHAALVELDLDDLELTRISLRGATLTEVTLRRARCSAADASDSRWQRCDLERADLSMAVLAGAQLARCGFARADLSGTSWHRAVVARCGLARAELVDARLDRAVFTDCDLRGADLSIARSPHVDSLAGAQFVRCDLRDTRWRGRDLSGATFVDCVRGGALRAAT